MVWHLEGGESSIAPGSPVHPSPLTSMSSCSVSMRGVSLGSSSIDLGPTPGSGMGLDSRSQSYLESDSETETVNQGKRSVISHEDSEIETGTDPLQWSREVESMINNPPLQTFQSFNLQADPSLSSWVLPQDRYPEDLSQKHYQNTHWEGHNQEIHPEEPYQEQPFSILQSQPSLPIHQSVRRESKERQNGRSTDSPGGAQDTSSRSSLYSEPLEDFTQQPSKI